MKTIKFPLKPQLLVIILSLFAFNQALAESDAEDPSLQFRGVFYGLLPCEDCAGTKTTLSLKHRNNYLLVTQAAKASSREYFDKGKYNWDDEAQIVTLTSRKGSKIRSYQIKDDNTIVLLSSSGQPLTSDQDGTSFILRKREMLPQKGSGHNGH